MILPAESALVGQWLPRGKTVFADATSRRIEALVTSYLVNVARSPDGWFTADGRLWEHSFPKGHMHGGGGGMGGMM